jgi:hypothetical protein
MCILNVASSSMLTQNVVELIVTDGMEGMCVNPGEMEATLEAGGVRGPGLPGGERAGSRHQTVEEDRCYKMSQKI